MSSLCVGEAGVYSDFRAFLKPEFRQEMCRPLLVAVIDPNPETRRAAIEALKGFHLGSVRCFSSFPATPANVNSLMEQDFDVILVGLDQDPESSFAGIAAMSSQSDATVMAYATDPAPDLLVQAMRSGVREFLPFPFAPGAMTEAFGRASSRLQAIDPARKLGSLYVFCGAKGGSGVTTVGSNFAVALSRDSGEKTVLIDLDVPLGDAALNMGITSKYSTLEALGKGQELDSTYFTGLLTEHACGLSVLGAPGIHTRLELRPGAADRLMAIARLEFAHVVVDAGSHWSWDDGSLFESASRIYLVTQVGIPELRNCNRVITSCMADFDEKLEVVLNRFTSKGSGLDDEAIEKALTRQALWRIPSDYPTVRKLQNDAVPLALGSSTISHVIHRMARKAAGLKDEAPLKKRFAIFG